MTKHSSMRGECVAVTVTGDKDTDEGQGDRESGKQGSRKQVQPQVTGHREAALMAGVQRALGAYRWEMSSN